MKRAVPFQWRGLNKQTSLFNGLIAFYPDAFNRGHTSKLYDVARGQHMTAVGTPQWFNSAQYGTRMELGTADAWQVVGSLAGAIKAVTTQFTIAQWLYPLDVPVGNDVYFHSARAATTTWTIFNRAAGSQLEHRVEASDPSSVIVASVYTAHAWYFVIDEYDASDASTGHKVYVNNAVVGTAATFGAVSQDAAQPVAIGQRCDATQRWTGGIMLTAMWKRVLTTAEKTELYVNPFVLYADYHNFEMESVVPVAAPTGSPWYVYAQQ